MWFECDAAEIREEGNRSFEERKRNSKGPAEHVVVQLHIDRERKLGAKGARDTQASRGTGPGATRLGEELAPVFIAVASVIEAIATCLLKRMAPRGFVETPLSFRRSQRQITRGAHQAPTPNYLFLRKLLARPALPLRFSSCGMAAMTRVHTRRCGARPAARSPTDRV